MKNFINKYYFNKPATLALLMLTAMSNTLLAIPKVASNPSGKSLDQVGDSVMTWFFDDIRPWIIVISIIAMVMGLWLGGRFRWAIAGSALGVIVGLMALPSIIARVYSWM